MTYQSPININIVNHRPSYRTVCTQSNTIDCTTINICSWNNCCTRKSHTTICKGHKIRIGSMAYLISINIYVINNRLSHSTNCTQSHSINCSSIYICGWNHSRSCKCHAVICKGHKIRIICMAYLSAIHIYIIYNCLSYCAVCTQSNTIDCTTINICSWNNCCTRKSHTTICKGHKIRIGSMTYQSPINVDIINHSLGYCTVCT